MRLDERLFALINSEWTSPILDWWAAIVRASEIWLVPAVAVLVVSLWRGSARVRATALLLLLVFAVGDGLIVRPTKWMVSSMRPVETLTVRSVRLSAARPRVLALFRPLTIRQLGPEPSPRPQRSFPSGHAWNAFAAATVLAMCHRRWGWVTYILAAAIAHARIYAGVHWPSDVLLSALVSVPVSGLLAVALDRAWWRMQPRLANRWSWARAIPTLLPERPAPAA